MRLNVSSSVKNEIKEVIEEYIDALNAGDEEEALKFLSEDNVESRYVNNYSDEDFRSLGVSMKVENIKRNRFSL